MINATLYLILWNATNMIGIIIISGINENKPILLKKILQNARVTK